MTSLQLNRLQETARGEGYDMILRSFGDRTPLDLPTLVGFINLTAHNNRTDEAVLQLHERSNEGDLMASTTIKISKSEAAAYRLMGALEGIEKIRQVVDSTGVRLAITPTQSPK